MIDHVILLPGVDLLDGGPVTPANAITTEAGDTLTTEAGDTLTTE